jgi:hypothetical protein
VSLGRKDHKLSDLWRLFIKIASAFGDDCSDAMVTSVTKCIEELAKIDPNSTAFRYASNLDGRSPDLPSHGLNLMSLHDVMNGIENFFECADLDFTHKIERERNFR